VLLQNGRSKRFGHVFFCDFIRHHGTYMASDDFSRETEITGAQLRAARAMLKLKAEEVAVRAKVSRRTVERLEQADAVPVTRALTMDALRGVYEAEGIEFTGTPNESPGVCLKVGRGHDAAGS